MSAPEWLRVGAEVGTYTNGRPGSYGYVPQLSVVTKIGKRDVVLEDGQRFNVTRLERSTGTWGPTVYLVRADDPTLLQKMQEYAVYRTAGKVGLLMESLRSAPDNLKPAHDALALIQWLIGDAS